MTKRTYSPCPSGQETIAGFCYLAFQLLLLPSALYWVNDQMATPVAEAELNFLYYMINFLAVLMIFLRKIVPGATDDSYGIEVAKLAGIPNVVISRAREILAELEAEGGAHMVPAAVAEPEDQVSLMDLTGQQIIAALSALTVETLTPIEAMNELYKLKKMLD